MKTYIVLLRGINVGGHKKVSMAELRALLTETGFIDVRTYIQSGNIVLSSDKSRKLVEAIVRDLIQSKFGFEVPIIARTRSQLLHNFQNCPWTNEKKEDSYFVLLSKVPENEDIENVVASINYQGEAYQIIDDCLYFYTSIGYGKSKFNMNTFERKLNVKATSRNFKTMVKLLSMSEEEQ